MKSRSFSKLVRFVLLVLAFCTPQVISFGDDQPSLEVATAKHRKRTEEVVSFLGTVGTYQPTWFDGQVFKARVLFDTPEQLVACTDAKLCFSISGTPVITAATATTLACDDGPGTAQWSRVATTKNFATTDTWATFTFNARNPSSGGTPLPDGTGKGIIIITQTYTTGTKDFQVATTLTVENAR